MSRPDRRPNLVVLLVDQWRASALGHVTGDPVSTPVLDQFATEALTLDSAVANYPVCSPCRAMLMTGQYPYANSVLFNVNSETAPWGVGLRREARCWSDVLGEHGYRAGHIGKWHLTPPVPDDEVHGEGRRDDGKVWDAWTAPEDRHGFEFWYSHGCCDQHMRPHHWDTDAPREGRTVVEEWSPAHQTDVAVKFLENTRDDDRPFALVLSINPPHQPFDQVPPEFVPAYEAMSTDELLNRPNVRSGSEAAAEAADVAPLYYAAITAVDEQIGRALDALTRLDLTEDTIVVFTSDHGMQLGSHDLMYKNVPYEESMRVPFMMRWPGRIAPGTNGVLFGSADFAPTVLSLMGLGDHIPDTVQGYDLSPAVTGAADAFRPAHSLYLGPAKDPGTPDVRGLRTLMHKFVARYHDDQSLTVSLFDLQRDPFETDDIADREPAQLEELSRALYGELGRTRDPWLGAALLLEGASA